MPLKDSHVLVTGGGRGIGLALAQAFARRGARVAICGRSQEALQKAKQAIGGEVACIVADLADEQTPILVREELARRWGVLDVLVNNAAIQMNYSFFELGADEACARVEEELRVNLAAPIELGLQLLPLLRGSAAPMIVNIGSGLALAPKAAAPTYCASKAGLRTFTRALRYQSEDAGAGLRCIDVTLPLVDTDMTRGRGRGKISAAEAAKQIIAGFEHKKREIWVGKAGLLQLIMRIAPALGHKIMR